MGFVDSVRLVLMMALSGSLFGVLASPVGAQDEGESLVNRHSSLEQLHNRIAIPQLSELEQPATTVKDWIAQIEASLVQIYWGTGGGNRDRR